VVSNAWPFAVLCCADLTPSGQLARFSDRRALPRVKGWSSGFLGNQRWSEAAIVMPTCKGR
jgi:hypothetical protein